MKTMLIGIGAAGNKAVLNAVEAGVMKVEDTVIINSTSKDFPKEYTGTKIVLSDGDITIKIPSLYKLLSIAFSITCCA